MSAKRILVADDYGDSADTLAQLLRIDDHEVCVALDGIQAVKVAEHFRPQILLLDLAMPKLDGFGVARRIRETPWGNAALLIAVTGWAQEEVRERCYQAGFNGHLVKPVDYVALSRLLNSCA